jgi:signal transduction histidine kinase
LLVLGTLFFVLVMIGLVWLCAWLIREMRLNQRQQAFVDAVSHELRTPLASFRLYLDTLSRHDLAPEKRSEFLDNMRQDLDRLEHTVGQVLAAARSESGGATARRERVDLRKLLSDCIAQVRERYRLPEEAVRLDGGAGARVQGDATELGLIFMRKIFQRFYRAGRDVQRQVAGLGLGLFVVRSLVRRQGGKVVAQSEGAGRGSRFVVTLRNDRGAS